jgi:hypothetical protein
MKWKKKYIVEFLKKLSKENNWNFEEIENKKLGHEFSVSSFSQKSFVEFDKYKIGEIYISIKSDFSGFGPILDLCDVFILKNKNDISGLKVLHNYVELENKIKNLNKKKFENFIKKTIENLIKESMLYNTSEGDIGIKVSDKELNKFSSFLMTKYKDEYIPLPNITMAKQKKLIDGCKYDKNNHSTTEMWKNDDNPVYWHNSNNGGHGWCCKFCGKVTQWG